MTKNIKTKTKTKTTNKFLDIVKNHKLVIFLIILLIATFTVMVAYPKYKDWDNAQLIKGLSRDFPILVKEIESATGLDLEITSNCATTTEKFSGGVKTCELVIASPQEQEVISEAVKKISESKLISEFRDIEARGFEIYYRNKNSCQMSSSDSVYISCLTAVREANTELAIQEFSKIND